MRASTGAYFSRLDHVRALAAFLVYFWHFVHVSVPFEHVPSFFLVSWLEEGHTGVALFMVLSGYLFARITSGRDLALAGFYWNRFVRLAPLLVLVLAFWAWKGRLTLHDLAAGLVQPTWPGGAWSITTELHFYLVFPLILALQRRHRVAPLLAILALAIPGRAIFWWQTGQVQDLAYWTIAGRIDQFVLGMLFAEISGLDIWRRIAHRLLPATIVSFAAVWQAFNLAGGYYGLGGHPSQSPLWIVIPTFEGLAYGLMIVAYEKLPVRIPRLLDATLARIGEASYSIYLLHALVFAALAKRCAQLGFDMTDFTVAALLAFATFPLVAAVAMVSYQLIEKPFLRLRTLYGAEPDKRPRHASPKTRDVSSFARNGAGPAPHWEAEPPRPTTV